jgi:hypothetical protein
MLNFLEDAFFILPWFEMQDTVEQLPKSWASSTTLLLIHPHKIFLGCLNHREKFGSSEYALYTALILIQKIKLHNQQADKNQQPNPLFMMRTKAKFLQQKLKPIQFLWSAQRVI